MMKRDASLLWNTLQGVICVYKPAETSVRGLRRNLIYKLCKDLSELDVKLRYPLLNSETNSSVTPDSTSTLIQYLSETTTNLVSDQSKTSLVQGTHTLDLRYHPLVVGPRYLEEDLPVSWSNFLGWNTSGVLLFGLRAGTQFAKYIRENRSTRTYRVNGVFGQATDTGFKTGKVVERSTWKYIKQHHLQKLLSTMQSSHQMKMFEMCGVDIQSQLAYELATKGPIRPANSKIPIIYGLQCIDYQGPNFTIEIQCINENEAYLTNIINEIGLKLHSVAHTTGIKCIRHSCFTLDHALLPKHLNLENIVHNMDTCNSLISKNEQVIKQRSVALG